MIEGIVGVAAVPEHAKPALAGCRIMVVEDELLVAMLIEETLLDEGCEVVGPYTSLAAALPAAGQADVALAVLDVNLRGERVYPVAEILQERGIPFVLLSGYGRDAVPADRVHWVACAKPFLPGELVRTLTSLLGT